MAQPFLGDIEAFPYSFAPVGWAFCAGQLLPIAQNQALFALLGTTFGGDGIRTFALPDLRGRIANGFGQGSGLAPYNLGQAAGEEMHTLVMAEMPAGGHNHQITAVNNRTTGGTNVPSGSVTLGSGYASETGTPAVNIYSSATPTVTMGSLTPTGGQPHENRMPFLGLNFCISLREFFRRRTEARQRSVEHDLIVLMIARRRMDGDEVELERRGVVEDETVHALRHDRRRDATQQQAEGGTRRGPLGGVLVHRHQGQRATIGQRHGPADVRREGFGGWRVRHGVASWLSRATTEQCGPG